MRRPLPFAIAATALMLLIAAPALSLREDTAAVAMFPEDFETRVGFDLASQALGEGAMGPVQVLADYGRENVDTAAVEGYAETVGGLPGVESVAAPVVSSDGRKALVVITPSEGPESDSTKALVERLRTTARRTERSPASAAPRPRTRTTPR